ncbi:HEAT repeat domain-containing protein [Tenggerimyces flavus]|uniref:HEAT repeat domain-containing protein n=1 Tax=Tenggerimyces flavus TaxID=1708749 RepID=A0ABV7YML5_9ACTN|nr:HEAT repeat domain-containing protein [Tenggerimyces flavus]MBM7786194.1 HEAT repeat protein [Tenggerimyces flavus]
MIEHAGLMEQVLADPEALRANCRHPDWRVRYACAVAMGECGDAAWLPLLYEVLVAENARQLYSQPRVREFVGSYDDTRMAEQLIRTEAVFDREYPEELKEDWRCRGRVRQACLFAVYAIGSATSELVAEIHRVLADPSEDSVVMAAGAMVLGKVGDRSSVPYLEQAMRLDEWCLRVEARKALAALERFA